ncbi:MAG: hypothetical protein ABIW76_19465 [Fibrobacteria bacterium]
MRTQISDHFDPAYYMETVVQYGFQGPAGLTGEDYNKKAEGSGPCG